MLLFNYYSINIAHVVMNRITKHPWQMFNWDTPWDNGGTRAPSRGRRCKCRRRSSAPREEAAPGPIWAAPGDGGWVGINDQYRCHTSVCNTCSGTVINVILVVILTTTVDSEEDMSSMVHISGESRMNLDVRCLFTTAMLTSSRPGVGLLILKNHPF